jgi:hypothetical protein
MNAAIATENAIIFFISFSPVVRQLLRHIFRGRALRFATKNSVIANAFPSPRRTPSQVVET